MKIMRQTDLELYRHKIHNLTRKKPDFFVMLPCNYWLEYGAFVSILPRQCGKTEMLVTITKNYSKDGEKIAVYCKQYDSRFAGILGAVELKGISLHGICYHDYNLIIDEFDFINNEKLRNIIDHPWKSVTMVSSKS